MKRYNIYNIVISIFFLLAGLGCQSDFLETKYDTNRTPQSIASDATTLFSFANQFYIQIQYGFTQMDNNLFATASDEAQQSASTSYVQIINSGALSAYNNPLSGLYQTYYEGIRAANFFLNYSNNARQFLALNRDTIIGYQNYLYDIQNIGWYRAEAHIARAYYYSELIKMYGGVPIINETFNLAAEEFVPRSSYDSCVNYIVSEIDTYKYLLQANWKTSSLYGGQDGRFSLGSALAIKARVLLYAASPLHNPTNDIDKWKRAASAANDVIKTPGLNYDLNASYASYFVGASPLTSKETIFAVRMPANNMVEKSNYPISTPGGNTGICPTHNLVADYEYIGTPNPSNPYLNRDPRLGSSIVTNGSTWNNRTINQAPGGTDDMSVANASPTGYYLKKFMTDKLNLVQGGTAQHQWIAYRYGELLLNYAEAMNEAYGPDVAPSGYTLTARLALKKIRTRASASLPLVKVTSIPDFRNALKHERRIELVFEDHRYWDLLRWGDAERVLNQPIQAVKISTNGTNYTYTVVNIAKRIFNAPANYYFPFSYSEIAKSKNTLVQNEGY